jgi:hypothetical protein
MMNDDVHDLFEGAEPSLGCEMRWSPPERFTRASRPTAAQMADDVDLDAAATVALLNTGLERLLAARALLGRETGTPGPQHRI